MRESKPKLQMQHAFDSKNGEQGKTSSFKPSKPANISRPENVKMPPPPKTNNKS